MSKSKTVPDVVCPARLNANTSLLKYHDSSMTTPTKSVRFDQEYYGDEDELNGAWSRAVSVARKRLASRKTEFRKNHGALAQMEEKNRTFSRHKWLAIRSKCPIDSKASPGPEEQVDKGDPPLWKILKSPSIPNKKDALRFLNEEVGDDKFSLARPSYRCENSSRVTSNIQRFATGSVARPKSAPSQPHPQRPDAEKRRKDAKLEHQRHRKFKQRSAHQEYRRVERNLRNIPESNFYFGEAGPLHDTDGDLTFGPAGLRPRHQRDALPEAETAHGNFRNLDRLTLYKDQLTLGTKPFQGSRTGNIAGNETRALSPSSSETSTTTDSDQPTHESAAELSNASSTHLNDDGTWKNPLTEVMHAYKNVHTVPASEETTMREL